jgi:hypothetical protein
VSLPYGGEEQGIAMTVHSRACHQAIIADMDRNMPENFRSPPLLKLAEPPSASRDSAATVSHNSLAETLCRDNTAHEQLIVEALRSGEAQDVVLIDRDTLNPADFEMLEKLNALGLSLPVRSGESKANDASDHSSQTEFGDLRFDFKICRAYWKNRAVDLTITQFNIVHLFARRIGENLAYREIYDIVHGEGFFAGEGTKGYQTNVRSLIKRIRQKFCEIDDTFDAIENHRGFGYRWQTPDDASSSLVTNTTEEREPESAPRSLVVMVVLTRQQRNQLTP